MLSVTAFGQKNLPKRTVLSGEKGVFLNRTQEQIVLEKFKWKGIYQESAYYYLEQWGLEADKVANLEDALRLRHKEIAQYEATVKTLRAHLDSESEIADKYIKLYEKENRRKRRWRNIGAGGFIIAGVGGFILGVMSK